MSALYERFLRGLARAPRRPAIRIGGQSLSFEQVHERALRHAGAVCADPAPRVVAALVGKGFEAYVAVLAGLYTGATVVPLSPAFPAARTRRMLQLSGARAILADVDGLAALRDLPDLDLPVHPVLPGDEGFDGIALDQPRAVRAQDAAYILFTSGSTGTPKGVPITHASTRHFFELADKRYDFHEEDVFSQTFDLNFDCAMFDMFCAWGAGASISPLPPHAFRDLPAALAEQRLTVWFSVPSTIGLVERMGGLTPGALPTLRWSLFAGEALRGADAAAWQAAAPRSTVENLYGPTELTITVTAYRWLPEVSADRCVNGLTPIGTVHEGHDHLLLDTDGAPGADEGELCVTGPQLTAGYLDPADDEGRFLDHDGRRWYRTGDRVRRLSGDELVYLGRRDGQVQVQGWRVELAEVDHAVASCAGVTAAVTVTRPGPKGLELVVYYTGTPVAPGDLARELRELLPAGMMPRWFHHVEEFPLNANRKVDRGVLAARAAVA
ncbi:AMP-binding protein [Catellatospora tritici]|uniref:AMP-binding protein n=1 Tax=Catellatospora tritici TaxID=2851566 RepID=UPI001C2D5840|nr:AMP-binding protein [Catellatospora tritici]MBV1855122.1 AMP-binding protein [Catellatospora tritici]